MAENEYIVYRWRVKWCGKWGATSYHCTEEQIRKEHPEAIAVESSREVRKHDPDWWWRNSTCWTRMEPPKN